MRLDNYISFTLNISRKQAAQLINDKQISVNDIVITNKDYKIDENSAIVKYNSNLINYEKYVYYMLNKPQGYVCDTSKGLYPSVFELIENSKNLSAAGRLDNDSIGLVLLTNDGNFVHKIIHDSNVYKTYICKTESKLSTDQISQLESGVKIYLEKEKIYYLTKPCKCSINSSNELQITINEGKFHQVKKMLEAVNNKVVELKRISIGSIELDQSLSIGEYRRLTQEEIDSIINQK